MVALKTGIELEEIFDKAHQTVKKKAKDAGAPLYYMHTGKRIREDANGQKFVIVLDADGNVMEYKLN